MSSLAGDDQQLAATGAGGVLRDIEQTHGALYLAELHRFTNPAEAQATLALRDGDPKSLDFYLKHSRVPCRRPRHHHRGCLHRLGPGPIGRT